MTHLLGGQFSGSQAGEMHVVVVAGETGGKAGVCAECSEGHGPVCECADESWGRIEGVHGETPIAEELPPFAAKRMREAAVRGLADRGNRNPAHPKVSRAQLP